MNASATRGELRGVAPILLVRDVRHAARYFTTALGFTVPRMWGDPPTFCTPRRDSLNVMLNQVDAGATIHPNASYDGRYDAYFYVEDVDALFREFSANGATVAHTPEDMPYGMREFSVSDPDGHLLAFGQDISTSVAHNHG